ncbi:hypothetical protein WMY93_013160 [Mugilogobius chulae]|uniref:RWD domain-containing protein 3 n=1 Tax=Mugilogobius chulae TaxID=88201 RepID=A0AAW0P2M2_9GOBI
MCLLPFLSLVVQPMESQCRSPPRCLQTSPSPLRFCPETSVRTSDRNCSNRQLLFPRGNGSSADESLQSFDVSEAIRGSESEVGPDQDQDKWVSVLSLDHIRSRNRYVSLLERWSKQLQLNARLLLGRNILVLLQGNRASIKEFCCLLKTVKVDVDSSGKKCKERLMKVLIEAPSSSNAQNSFQGFVVRECESLSELSAAFEEVHLSDVYKNILPSLRD